MSWPVRPAIGARMQGFAVRYRDLHRDAAKHGEREVGLSKDEIADLRALGYVR